MQNYNKYFDYSLFSCNFVAVKLSIIIPVYQVEATLNRCLQSIADQTFGDFEAILVDDGSPDRCPKMCDEWAEKDSRFRVIHKQNGGLSDARNAGLDAARGQLVTFVDSDDYLDTKTYEQVIPIAEGCDIVEFPLFRFYGTDKQMLICFEQETFTDMKDYWLRGRAYEHCYAWNKIYQRRLFSSVHYPKGRVFEDAYTLPRLLKNTHRLVTSNRGLYYYCANAHGITATATGQELQMLLDAHMSALSQWCDDRYYMHVLNIQLDVCRLLGISPELPIRRISPFSNGLTATQRMKALLLNTIGFKNLCKINTKLHKS